MLTLAAALVVGAALLVWGADRFVDASGATARHLGVSPMVVGLVVVGFGTSAPELLVSALAAWQGNPGVAIGNALGSNIANIGLVLGVAALVTPLVVHSTLLRRELPILMAIMLLVLALLEDDVLGRGDGLVLLSALAVVLSWLVSLARHAEADPLAQEVSQEIPAMAPRRAYLWLVAGLAVLVTGAQLVVHGAVGLAQALGVSDLVIGLTVVAVGTSLPELAAAVISVRKGEHDLALGNVVGSNIFNLLGVVGVAAVIAPGDFPGEALSRDFPVMIGLTLALFAMAYGFRGPGRITRWEGAGLLAAFVAYMGWLALDSV